MKNFTKPMYKQIAYIVATGLAMAGLVACSNDEPSDRKFTPLRLDLSNGEALTLLQAESRADDEYSAGLFKVDANGNMTAVETIVRYDEKNNASMETTKVRVLPDRIINVDDNFMILPNCTYIDAEGTVYDNNIRTLLVHKSDGLIYSLDNLIFGSDSFLWDIFAGPGAEYVSAGSDKFYISTYESKIVAKISISQGTAVAEQLTTSAINVPYGKLFAMDGDKVAATDRAQYAYDAFDPNSIYRAVVVYPNGGYEMFGNSSFGFSLAILNNSILEFSRRIVQDSDNNYVAECRWIHLGAGYGETTSESLSPISSNYAQSIASWYETANNVILKCNVENKSKFMIFDKATKQFQYPDISFSGIDNLELWKENLDGECFYGLVRNANDQITKVCRLNPNSLDFGEIDLNLTDIDIATIVPDYKHGKVQLIGTRRSDGYNVAATVDLHNGKMKTLFSEPHRGIQALIPLN